MVRLGGVFVVLVCACVCCFNAFVDCVSDVLCDGVRFLFCVLFCVRACVLERLC